MNALTIIKQMCSERLTVADINAICKARGFLAKEMKNRDVLENILLSGKGLADVFSQLSRKEITLLYALKRDPEPVDVTFFGRIYKKGSTYGTFNQKYKDVFNNTRNAFIRRGILFFAEEEGHAWEKKSRLERAVFYFPKEFYTYLPPLFKSVHQSREKGDCNTSLTIKKLNEIKGPPNGPGAEKDDFKLRLSNGQLCIGDIPFSDEKFKEWQYATWVDAIAPDISPQKAPQDIIDIVRHTLSYLKPDEWVPAGELRSVIKIFTSYSKENIKFDSDKICATGWEMGFLEKKKIGKDICYRLHEEQSATTERPVDAFLLPDKKLNVIVDLDAISIAELEELAAISDFKVVDTHLTATPNFIRFGRAYQDIYNSPLTAWLRKNVPAYDKVGRKVASKWGKQVIHTGLLIAKVNDLSLKVAIQKKFSNPSKIVFLPEDYIAFPKAYIGEIQSLVKKEGFVVKHVDANESKSK